MKNKKDSITVLGDVHGKYDEMEKLCLHNDHIIQLGDLGFDYTYIYENYNPKKFKVFLGNHDNYDYRPKKYDLGDFGMTSLNGMEFFFVRGAWSIDIISRKRAMGQGVGKCWWNEEELSRQQMEECLKLYEKTKQNVVLSHTCPESISELVSSPGIWQFFGWDDKQPDNTQRLLEEMLKIHLPKLWCFGHYHINWRYTIKGTHFICVNELNTISFDKNWSII